MGLDVSHDCWSGPYSAFMRWRCHLHYMIMHKRGVKPAESGPLAVMVNAGISREALEAAWEVGYYDDQADPINVLMNHSDCDGEIPADVCGPLADALQGLLDWLPRRAMYDEARPATERFIEGLRFAAERGERVTFG